MVVLFQQPSLSGLQVFHATDPLLSNGSILVFYGPSPTPNANPSTSSRVQCHVFAAAGLQSFPKLIVSPGSSLYSAVEHLSREDQGDEICRALAVSILKYFTELPEIAKSAWTRHSLSSETQSQTGLRLWESQHAAHIATRMVALEDPSTAIRFVETALSTQSISTLDLDLVLPPASITPARDSSGPTETNFVNDDDGSARYGQFGPLIKLFGEPTFLPTSRIRRAPSKPTALNRTATFTKSQKENIRREMVELGETENSYVDKLSYLANGVAANFRDKAHQKSSTSFSPDAEALQTLFPRSLNTMLDVNSGFLQAIETVLENTDRTARKDLDSNFDLTVDSISTDESRASDPTGAVAFANILLNWFPKFSDCYTEYIQAHAHFGPFLKTHASNSQSSFAHRVQETGEQQLMSMLIEPVQRLPRYSLYVENIIKQLPIRHPALKSFLKAKDIIADICSQDGTSSPLSRLGRIKQLVTSWPSTCSPQGRFILAVDIAELHPPYDPSSKACNLQEFLLLLFAGNVILVKKLSDTSLSARSFMVEAESPMKGSHSYEMGAQGNDTGLVFSQWAGLEDLNFLQAGSDCLIKWVPSKPQVGDTVRTATDTRIRTFAFKGMYEGRASRWIREFAKARVEGRFSEGERESVTWEARLLEADKQGLSLFVAIFEDGNSTHDAQRNQPSSVRVVMNTSKDATKFRAGQSGVDIVASVSPKGEGFWLLEVETANERGTRDLTTESEFIPVLCKRLGNFLQMRSQVRNPALATYLLQHNHGILNALNATLLDVSQPHEEEAQEQKKPPSSPVKLLSNLFGSRSFKDNSKSLKIASPSVGKIPNFAPPRQPNPLSHHDSKDAIKIAPKSVAALLGNESKELPANPLHLLEQTFNSYLLAIRTRKGNVVGTVVARRGAADEATVNELNNTLTDNPGNYEKAAQVPVDVLFAAFEKFIKISWKDLLGPIIPASILSQMQNNIGVLTAMDYDEFIEQKLSELAPQNRRAFGEIVGLLADLLSAMRNDGDRGALTAAFAEILVSDGNAYEFIYLLDKLVEDHEVLLPERPPSQGLSSGFASSASSLNRTVKTGSLSSKASSLSRRLGLGSLRREPNRSETQSADPGSNVGSKKPLPPEPLSDNSALGRTRSIDLTSRLASLRRPGSRDRTTAIDSPAGSRPGTSHSTHSTDRPETAMSSQDNSPLKKMSTLKKKRRSSLSDLRSLQTPSASPFWTTSASKQVDGIFQTPSNDKSSTNALASDSPLRHKFAYPGLSTENNDMPTSLQEAYSEPQRNDPAKGKENSTIRKADSSIHLPSTPPFGIRDGKPAAPQQSSPSKGVLAERISSGNTPPPLNISTSKTGEKASPSKSSEQGSPRKLRMQSPAKLRERIQGHQQAVNGANTTLVAEIAKISEEIDAMNARPVPPPKNDAPPSPAKHEAAPQRQASAEAFNLNTRLKALEGKVTHLLGNLSDRSAALEGELASSAQVLDRRAKKLDMELQRANAENEALYTRMNAELTRIFDEVQGDKGVEELKRQLKESQEEAAKWRKEAARVKRENVALRSHLAS